MSFVYAQAKCALYALGLTATLYLGPLVTLALDRELPGQENFEYKRDVQSRWDNVWGLRNYVVVSRQARTLWTPASKTRCKLTRETCRIRRQGPLTEEVIFRGCIVGLAANTQHGSTLRTIFLTPLYFAVAHLHHAYEVWTEHERSLTGLKIGLTHASFQLLYTSLFGWYANWLFIKSTSLVPPLIAHVWCNIMGLPSAAEDASRLSLPDARRQRFLEKELLNVSDPSSREAILQKLDLVQIKLKRRKWIVWTSHVLGVLAFARAIKHG